MAVDVRSDLRGRVDAWALSHAWRRGVAELSANKRLFTTATSPLVAVAAVSALVLPRTFLNGAFLGLVVTLAVAYPVWTATTVLGARRIAANGQVEELTAVELGRLDRRQVLTVDQRDLAHVEVDHVAIGPDGLVAITSVWRRDAVRFADLTDLSATATRDAATLRERLELAGVRRDVTPCVVVWGPGAAQLAGSAVVHHEARVVAGPDLVRWCRGHLGSGTLDLAAFGVLRDARRPS